MFSTCILVPDGVKDFFFKVLLCVSVSFHSNILVVLLSFFGCFLFLFLILFLFVCLFCFVLCLLLKGSYLLRFFAYILSFLDAVNTFYKCGSCLYAF